MSIGRVIRRTAAAVVLGVSAGVGVGVGTTMADGPLPPQENSAAAAAVAALVADDAAGALAVWPSDFRAVMGYEPVIEIGSTPGGVLTDPHGSCSSPISLPELFEPACRIHDLGYDLLRYARDTGGELGPAARLRLDEQLSSNLNAACGTGTARPDRTCDVISGISSAAVKINSWRQDYRIPVSDSPLPYLVATASAMVAGGVFSRRGLL